MQGQDIGTRVGSQNLSEIPVLESNHYQEFYSWLKIQKGIFMSFDLIGGRVYYMMYPSVTYAG